MQTSKYYINPKGELFWDSTHFRKVCYPIDGVTSTEMWDSCLTGENNSNLRDGVLWDINEVPDERHNVPFLEFVRFDLIEIYKD